MPEQLGVFSGLDTSAGPKTGTIPPAAGAASSVAGGGVPTPVRGTRPARTAHPRAAAGRRAAAAPGAPVAASELPVARVAVDVGHAHLDRPFDYLVPQQWAEDAVPGARVRVRFAGRLLDGFILERCERSDHEGRLAFLNRVVSGEPVLAPEIAQLARAVADRYAGTVADVLRLAVPPRHARVEKELMAGSAGANGCGTDGSGTGIRGPAEGALAYGAWSHYPHGEPTLSALRAGGSPRIVWWALPGPSWPAMVAAAVAATVASARGALVVVPDHRDVDRVAAALEDALGPGGFVALRADAGPAERYRRFLAVRRGRARVVVGTRAAVFAPVADLGLILVWDDGDDLHAEPRSPYPHVRDVAVLRARQQRSALIVGGWSPSTEAEAMVRVGWAAALIAPRPAVRAAAPRVEATGSDFEEARDPAARAARLPSLAWRAAGEALAAGTPVLVQVPRRGYQPALACAGCRRPARCRHCRGPLGRHGGLGPPTCGWCARPAVGGYADDRRLSAVTAGERPVAGPAAAAAAGGGWPPAGPAGPAGAKWQCPYCRDVRFRASVVGDRRTAEELGRAFPGAAVRTSGRDGVLATVAAAPALVVATPGAEPVADGGYGAVLLLDTWALLGRPDLRAAEETLRRWCAAAALARPAADGGRVVVIADAGLAVVQALTRWDPAWFVRREADERAALGFPPATRVLAVEGVAGAVAELVAAAQFPAGVDVLGPVPLDEADRPGGARAAGRPGGTGAAGRLEPAAADRPEEPAAQQWERVLVRVPRAQGQHLATAVKAARGVLDARRSAPVRVVLDPITLV
ncbi:primosomal protein N' [Protofrankia symbiont of Coriaria ruscifolia]|uniref:primosomal protein N' n=1 Tax=Protofrankia symbiont of Coriaria ruscifolia TaxID=1306542 RepID=UPI001041530C|nr:primosomal protein N' [Protofrankia symbiont of Coriaria ruscifolia]